MPRYSTVPGIVLLLLLLPVARTGAGGLAAQQQGVRLLPDLILDEIAPNNALVPGKANSVRLRVRNVSSVPATSDPNRQYKWSVVLTVLSPDRHTILSSQVLPIPTGIPGNGYRDVNFRCVDVGIQPQMTEFTILIHAIANNNAENLRGAERNYDNNVREKQFRVRVAPRIGTPPRPAGAAAGARPLLGPAAPGCTP